MFQALAQLVQRPRGSGSGRAECKNGKEGLGGLWGRTLGASSGQGSRMGRVHGAGVVASL